MMEKSKLPALGYANLLERSAERFHVEPGAAAAAQSAGDVRGR